MTDGDYLRITPRLALVGGGEYGLSNRLDCHVYLLTTATAAVLVDTGAGAEPDRLLRNLATAGVPVDRLSAVVLTHAHADHAGGVAALADRTGAAFYAAEPERALLADGDEERLGLTAAKLFGSYPSDYRYRTSDRATAVADNQRLRFDDLTLTALVTPGHTTGSVVWHAQWPEYAALLTGDTLFAGGTVSVSNLPGSDAAALRASLPRLAELEIDGLFPGHGAFVVRGGRDQVALAAARMRGSVIPNRAVPAYSVTAELRQLATQIGGIGDGA